MRERSFVRRNKKVQLRELTELVALRKEDAREGSLSQDDILAQTAPDVPKEQLRAFENAGWVFQERDPEASPDAYAQSQAQVFVKSGGRIALGTNVLNVQLKEGLSEDEANAALQPHGCRVIEGMSFAPGLFRVAVVDPSQGDAVDVADQLLNSGLVQFAEPELIEVVGPRSS